MRTVVVGGGLAGVSAALTLAQHGVEVVLLERSCRLGGRASSFFRKKAGIEVDTGQHALLGCCTNLLDFYKRIGASQLLRWSNSITFAEQGRASILGSSALPEPMHLMPSLLASRHLSLSDKIRAVKLLKTSDVILHEDVSTYEWLSGQGQSSKAISGFWEPILTAALNESLDRASARHSEQVIRLAMLVNRYGFHLGTHVAPLWKAHHEVALQALDSAGVSVQFSKLVTNVQYASDSQIHIKTFNGEELLADTVVIATNPGSRKLLDETCVLNASNTEAQCSPVNIPIVTTYLWSREKLDIPPITCIPGGRFHWCFNRSEIGPKPEGYSGEVALVWSAAYNNGALNDEELRDIALSELESVFPGIRPILQKCVIVRCNAATFSPFVGCDHVRPVHRTTISGIFIAGDWTATGWPGTMEGAVRSGYACAAEILQDHGVCSDVPVPDIEPRGLARFLFKG